MKVLFVEPFGHREGHPSFESRRVSYALVDAEAEITLLTFMGVQGDWADKEKRVIHISLFRPRRSILRYYQFLNRSTIIRPLFRILETFLILSLAIWKNRRRQYDVVHIEDAEPAIFFCLAFASFLKGYNFVLMIFNPPPPHEDWRNNLINFFKSRRLGILIHTLGYEVGESRLGAILRRWVYRRALRNNNINFVCHTRELVQSYEAYMQGIFRDRFVCIPMGMETSTHEVSMEHARRHLGLPTEGKIFLTFGTNHPGKNFEVIFQALGGLTQDFLIMQAGKLGSGPEAGDPQQLAARYGCSQNTIVKDIFVSEEEKWPYFLAADAVILSYKEHFIQSAAILSDAAKFSTPVIASDVGQLGDFVKTYGVGIIFTPDDPHSLRQAILHFLELPQAKKEVMKSNFARLRADYTWKQNAHQHLEIYKRLGETAQKLSK